MAVRYFQTNHLVSLDLFRAAPGHRTSKWFHWLPFESPLDVHDVQRYPEKSQEHLLQTWSCMFLESILDFLVVSKPLPPILNAA
jgi:hypothetical protein